MTSRLTLCLCFALTCFCTQAYARPPGPQVVCETYMDAVSCRAQTVSCVLCHSGAPTLNPFGEALEDAFIASGGSSSNDEDFSARLPALLGQIESGDADLDGSSNKDEIQQGFLPGDASSTPTVRQACSPSMGQLAFEVCGYNPVFVYKKVMLDFCGRSPSRQEMQAFALTTDTKKALHAQLDQCLDSAHWQGPGGVVERLSYPKVRPRKPFERATIYEEDFKLFVYTQIDDHDARDLLRARYAVEYVNGEYRTYQPEVRSPQRARGLSPPERRAGMVTSQWFISSNTMGASIPRVTAAQAYRAYLGYDLSTPDGVYPVANEPQDYDSKGVAEAECAVCHSTLDPLAYLFSTYVGSAEADPSLSRGWNPDRIATWVGVDGPRVAQTPSSGWLFGEPVEDLVVWGEIASESDAFAQTLVKDYWRLLLGHDPRAEELDVFRTLWQDFKTKHNWQIEAMLHALIDTEAYGEP